MHNGNVLMRENKTRKSLPPSPRIVVVVIALLGKTLQLPTITNYCYTVLLWIYCSLSTTLHYTSSHRFTKPLHHTTLPHHTIPPPSLTPHPSLCYCQLSRSSSVSGGKILLMNSAKFWFDDVVCCVMKGCSSRGG